MAKFIALPYGEHNPETGKLERKYMLVNLDRVVTVKPNGNYQFSSVVVLSGGKNIQVYRRYETMCAQITGRTDLMESFDSEEISAAFEEGYAKAKAEFCKTEARQAYDLKREVNQVRLKLVKEAVKWISSNPLGSNWKSELDRALKAATASPVIPGEATVPEDDEIEIDIF